MEIFYLDYYRAYILAMNDIRILTNLNYIHLIQIDRKVCISYNCSIFWDTIFLEIIFQFVTWFIYLMSFFYNFYES